ncbi:hypothetical protein OS190_07100 [Sulfitobacter sp. F26204]|uniref:hypothetical protein n=1 Tax=Sulfitobacter sp. F26204 TaxID=2996014 RepID=UPI00225DDB8E|nr:hypothetical protein [Sulfitobacter sp. F26204]MCX7559333.1 hypothetical protein [Sulfitobacter sp. F26204]
MARLLTTDGSERHRSFHKGRKGARPFAQVSARSQRCRNAASMRLPHSSIAKTIIVHPQQIFNYLPIEAAQAASTERPDKLILLPSKSVFWQRYLLPDIAAPFLAFPYAFTLRCLLQEIVSLLLTVGCRDVPYAETAYRLCLNGRCLLNQKAYVQLNRNTDTVKS